MEILKKRKKKNQKFKMKQMIDFKKNSLIDKRNEIDAEATFSN